jgi:hypothetical protein
VAQRLSELLKEEADQNFKAGQDAKARKNARIVAGVDAQGHVIPGGPKDKPGKGKSSMLPPKSNSDALAGIDKAEAQLRKQIRLGRSPEESARLLREGRDAVEGYPSRYTVNGKSYKVDPQTGTVLDGNKPLVYPGTTRIVKVDKAKLPALSALNPLYVRAALDRVAYHGRYRKSTLKALHDAGVRIPARLRKPVSRARCASAADRKANQTFAEHLPGRLHGVAGASGHRADPCRAQARAASRAGACARRAGAVTDLRAAATR